jgi:hypothetical protein
MYLSQFISNRLATGWVDFGSDFLATEFLGSFAGVEHLRDAYTFGAVSVATRTAPATMLIFTSQI